MAFSRPITRYIAIDLGDRRTGLAVGDDHTKVAAPWKTIQIPIEHENGAKLINAIKDQIQRDYGASPALELVLGLPIHLDGQESQRSELSRAFAKRLEAQLGRVVHLADERLTSKQADWSMNQSGLTHLQKKRRRDAIAAASLLQGFLNALPREGNNHHAHPKNQDGSNQGD